MKLRNWQKSILTTGYCIGALALVAGCQRTLLFAEHDGFNLAIRADPKQSPPFEVNLGFERAVGTIVPPTRHNSSDGSADGEAVNMFAGFQLDRGAQISPTTGPQVDIRIATQFASGAAATAIAEDPNAVARIVNVRNPSAVRIAVGQIGRVEALSQRILDISDREAARAAQDLHLTAPPQDPRDRLQNELGRVMGNADSLARFERDLNASLGRVR